MTSSDIRQRFLDYFRDRGHRVVPSAPLVPADDPTLLFTNAGMNQFKGLFLGAERRDYRRAATAQKCMRVSGKHNDLENVGPSLRHHTFFEMLGNFSFGDYFKAEAIPFAWELLTDVWRLPADRLYVTVFRGEDGVPRDDEAHAVWRRLVPASRIVELGSAENFWAMGETGPCGRCSEVHYHRGDDLPCGANPCRGLDCDCDRYVEIWNNVFMEFERRADGALTPLPAPSIDTGMGLERMAAVLQETCSNYDTDLFAPLLAAIGKRTGTRYGPRDASGAAGPDDVSLRVVADHLRAMTFLIADGVLPSNEWRGYVLRKIMRRAMRHGRKLGVTEPFLHELTGVVIAGMGGAYPELGANRDLIAAVVQREEAQFDRVLADGLPRLEAALTDAATGARTLDGDQAFRLYDTFGLPIDVIEDLAAARAVQVDRDGFDRALAAQRARARAGAAFDPTARPGPDRSADADADADAAEIPDRFVGYDATTVQAQVRGLYRIDRRAGAAASPAPVTVLDAGTDGLVVLDPSPFYLEAGGQVSDTGRLSGADVEAAVQDVTRPAPGRPRRHVVTVRTGALRVGDVVTAEVDAARRDDIRRNHTATHLLHAALRQVVGAHVRQAGSLVAPDRLRFDITHHEPVTAGQRRDLERRVNRDIFRNQPVRTEERPTRAAIADGALALFGEKYGDRARVVTVPGVSVELCGGTHCRATGDIGPFVLTREGGVAAGVRRLEAVTGPAAVRLLQERDDTLTRLLEAIGTVADQAVPAVRALQTEAKRLAREVERLTVQAALSADGGAPADAPGTVTVDGVALVARRVSGLDPGALRSLADSLRAQVGSGVIVLASDHDGKAALMASVTRDLTDRVHAGRLVQALAPIVGGRGGGRPDFAQAGGRDIAGLDAVVPESRAVVSRLLTRT